MSNFAAPASEFMHAPVHRVGPDESLHKAHRHMQVLGVSGLAVTEGEDRLVGVVTRTDLLQVGRRQAGSRPDALLLTLPDQPVSSVMVTDVATAAPNDPLHSIAKQMLAHRIHRVFVLRDGALSGVVSTRDLMRAIRQKRVAAPLSSCMSSPAFTVRGSEPIALATDRLSKAHVSGLVVVDEGWPIGVFTQEEALASRDLETSTPTEEAMNPAILSLPASTPLFRAAEQAAALDVRRIVALDGGQVAGIVTGLNFAQVASA